MIKLPVTSSHRATNDNNQRWPSIHCSRDSAVRIVMTDLRDQTNIADVYCFAMMKMKI